MGPEWTTANPSWGSILWLVVSALLSFRQDRGHSLQSTEGKTEAQGVLTLSGKGVSSTGKGSTVTILAVWFAEVQGKRSGPGTLLGWGTLQLSLGKNHHQLLETDRSRQG